MSINTSQPAPTPSPLDTRSRALAPDLARGFMLLAIALAHTPLLVMNAAHGPELFNKIAEFVNHLLVNNQARPLFVFLFGYGLAQLTLRQQARGEGWPSIRKLLRRRGFWLLVIGIVHGLVLVPLDILAPYGIALLLGAALVRAKDTTLLWVAGVMLIPATAIAAVGLVVTEIHPLNAVGALLGPLMSTDPTAALRETLVGWPFGTLIGTLMVFPGMLLGVWAARRRYLDEPQRHELLLRRTALGLLSLALLTRLPAALEFSGLGFGLPEPVLYALAVIQPLTGYFGGIGLAALIGWMAVRLNAEPGRITTALTALGQRSLTFYVFQSVMFVVLYAPFILDLRAHMGFGAASVAAVGIWLISVVIADLMARRGYRGPLEKLLRALTYRRREAKRA